MSPWTETQRSRWTVYAGIAVILVGFVAGFLLMTDGVGGGGEGGDGDARTPGPAPSDGGSPGPGGPALEVVSWGTTSGQLAVVVRNASSDPIEDMRVRITARDSAGATVVSTSGTAPDVCCTIVGLPPGRYFGLFAEVDPDAARRATHVEVEPVPEPDAARGGAAGAPRVVVDDTRLARYEDDTVVTARLTARGPGLSGYVAAQAFLVDPDGRVAQVISGRFYCFGPGQSREVRLRLFHAVPTDLRLDDVVAYPIPGGTPPHVPGRCG